MEGRDERATMLTGAMIRAKREEMGMTRTQFAQKCGFTRNALYQYENDKRVPKGKYLQSMLEVMKQQGDEATSIHTIIDNAMKSKDRYVIIAFRKEGPVVKVYPLNQDND